MRIGWKSIFGGSMCSLPSPYWPSDKIQMRTAHSHKNNGGSWIRDTKIETKSRIWHMKLKIENEGKLLKLNGWLLRATPSTLKRSAFWYLLFPESEKKWHLKSSPVKNQTPFPNTLNIDLYSLPGISRWFFFITLLLNIMDESVINQTFE